MRLRPRPIAVIAFLITLAGCENASPDANSPDPFSRAEYLAGIKCRVAKDGTHVDPKSVEDDFKRLRQWFELPKLSAVFEKKSHDENALIALDNKTQILIDVWSSWRFGSLDLDKAGKQIEQILIDVLDVQVKVYIKSEPTKASICVDGTHRGKTNFPVRVNKEKKHTIRLHLDGYADHMWEDYKFTEDSTTLERKLEKLK